MIESEDIKKLSGALWDMDPVTRIHGGQALVQLAQAVLETLTKGIGHENEKVRQSAREALEKLKPAQDVKVSTRDMNISNLQKIFRDAAFSPVFKPNPKYSLEGVPRIAYGDVMDYKFIIHCDKNFPESGFMWSDKKAPIISSYSSLEESVDDGWRLD